MPLPGLNFGAGAVNALAAPPNPITPDPVLVGASANDVGSYKAAVWRYAGLRFDFVVTQLPDLGVSDPEKVSGAYDLLFDLLGRAVVVGSAENDGLLEQPVVWREGEGGVFGPPSTLSLCAGCVAGEVTAIYPPDPGNEWFLTGWGEDAQGNREAIFWHTDNDGASYAPVDLGVLPGFGNSQGAAVAAKPMIAIPAAMPLRSGNQRISVLTGDT